MRLRTWLILGYSAVLALATLGLGLALVTVLGLAATSGRMVDENFHAVEVASQLRRLVSEQQLVVARRLAYLADRKFAFVGTWDEVEGAAHPELRAFLEGREEEEAEDAA